MRHYPDWAVLLMVRGQGDSCKKQRSWKPKTWIAMELDISQKDVREVEQ